MQLKYKDYLVIITIILLEIAIWAETDIFIPSMPDMVGFFHTSEDKIQNILSINFLGLFLSALVAGPISDAYGRKKIITIGMLIFTFASIGCAFATTFGFMLFFRFVQGLGAGIPMALAWVIIMDLFHEDKVVQVSGWMNSIITAVMAGAPILGSTINEKFTWKGNFIAISIFSVLAFLSTVFLISESHPLEKRTKFSIKKIIKDYSKLSKNFGFTGNVALVCLNYSGIMIYIANLSLIFINHLNVSVEEFGYLQASTMSIYMIASGINSILVKIYGAKITNYVGGWHIVIGSILLLIVGMFFEKNILMICLAMGIFTAGVAISINIVATKAMVASKELKGTAASVFTVTRLIIISFLIELSAEFFTGSIFPISIIIFFIMLISVIIHLRLMEYEKITAKHSATL